MQRRVDVGLREVAAGLALLQLRLDVRWEAVVEFTEGVDGSWDLGFLN